MMLKSIKNIFACLLGIIPALCSTVFAMDQGPYLELQSSGANIAFEGSLEQAEKLFTDTLRDIVPTINNLLMGLNDSNSLSHTDYKQQLTAILKNHGDRLLPFLTRPFETVQIDSRGQLIISEDEKLLYTALEYLGSLVPYRGFPRQIKPGLVHSSWDEETFYDSGPSPSELASILPRFDDGAFCHIEEPNNVYSIRATLHAFDLELPTLKANKPILIIPSWTHPHATLTVNVLDLDSRKVLISIFVNTCQSKEYYKYFDERLNLEDYRGFTLNEDQIEKLTAKFPNYTVSSDGITRIHCNWKFPLIDCTFDLQRDDQNCALYIHNYTRAILLLLNKVEVINEIQSAAKILSENPTDKEKADSLKTMLQNQVKPYLLQYYESNGQKKSPEAIKDYHMKFRWHLSSEFLSRFFKS